MKKFKPPSFINGIGPRTKLDEPPVKKIKLHATAEFSVPETTPQIINPTRALGIAKRKLLLTINNPPVSSEEASSDKDVRSTYYNVVWRKPTTKKHKTWDGDGILIVTGVACVLQDTRGKDLARGRLKIDLKKSSAGDILSVGGKECELGSEVPRGDYLSGKVFLQESHSAPVVDYTALKSQARAQFKNPKLKDTLQAQPKSSSVTIPRARHDPKGHNALVLSRPSASITKGEQHVIDVVVDPVITQFLRPHQRDGVSFLYDCIMRFKDYDGAGAILADEMGLGKTLQTIALIWTLLKQHFMPGHGSLARKALIVCPVTLVNNWKREFRKWLGQDKIGVFVVDSKANLRDFLYGKIYQVMIIGYEKLRLVQETDELKNANFDLIICDEGHKLKSANNKSALAIKSLKTSRRIILSGTPIQNDLGEFFVMIDFVNPGLLGTYQTFRKEFENPIMKARQPEASKKDKEKGALRSAELSRLTNMFILRRTASLLTGYLPPKTDFVVFCQPTDLQISLHKVLLAMPAVEQCLGGQNSAFQLKAIMYLRKICNSPALLSTEFQDSGFTEDPFLTTIQALVTSRSPVKSSGKLLVLEKLLLEIAQTEEKVVIVSQFTQTLHIIQGLLEAHNMPYCRLDGTTASNKRQEIVDIFNRSPRVKKYVFLLSAKSGGCGLNLIGASRLILYDSDWNPSVDLQAMARIHRDGQKRAVFIYRLLTAGMIDEKIYQRQVTKQGLSDALMDGKASGSGFSLEELRDLFQCHKNVDCLTHDMLQCSCKHDGQNQVDFEASIEDDLDEATKNPDTVSWVKASQVQQADLEVKAKPSSMKALRQFDHISAALYNTSQSDLSIAIGDSILEKVLYTANRSQGCVSYVFAKQHGILAPEEATVNDAREGPI